MILDKNAEILIGNANIKYYLSVGYDVSKGDKVLININDLRRGTPIKINVKCDICGVENKIYLQKYHFNKDRCGYYSCVKCSDNIKYGADNVSQSEIIKDKKKETEYVFQSDKLQDNIKKTKLERYGNENFTNRKKSNETCLEKYGVENVSQSDIIKKRKCETSIINYGVEYPSQNKDVFNKQQKSALRLIKYKNTDLYYQGTYELDFLDKYYDKLEISKNKKSIKYIYKNKIKYYHPDFYFDKLNLIIEIKSDYTLVKELDKNLAKQKSCVEFGYNFIFIINKDYSIFEDIVFS
jgi:hypothetical protein